VHPYGFFLQHGRRFPGITGGTRRARMINVLHFIFIRYTFVQYMIDPITLLPGKKIYFASDLHLGVPDAASSLAREKRFVEWLDQSEPDMQALFVLGDLFDFWYEYRQVVPKGFVRVLGKLASLRDKNIPVYFFTGNHDQWMNGYFEEELQIPVFRAPERLTINGKKFFLAHGDGLGPGDHGYKFLKKLFRSPVLQWCFSRLHPNFGVWLGRKWSRDNRLINGKTEEHFMGEEGEWLIQFCRETLKTEPVDFFLFGHRHLMLDYTLQEHSRYINLGDWIRFHSYATFDGKQLALKQFA